MSKGLKIFNWIASVFCLLTLPAMGFSLGTLITFMVGVASLPIEPIRNLWSGGPQVLKKIKVPLLVILFFIGVMYTPTESDTNKAEAESKVAEETSNQNDLDDESDVEDDTTSLMADTETKKDDETSKEDATTKEEETTTEEITTTQQKIDFADIPFSLSDVPAYAGSMYVAMNGNVPYFDGYTLPASSCEYYSDLDSLGRCGVTYACVGRDIMPTEERGEIGSVKPTGWHTVKYNGIVSGNYLYNRCHLIGYQLTGENANTKNLITGTRALNVDGMLPFENMVADYVNETGNHVMYRVTPMFDGNNLLATGVMMEAKSVEDNGDGILFCVFVYNVQEGIVIDYTNGDSYAKEVITTTETPTTTEQPTTSQEQSTTNSENTGKYAVNMNNGKIHMVGECSATSTGDNAMNNAKYFDTYEEAEAYSIQIAPDLEKRQCGNCW